jgi:hypothetical protein
VQADGHNAIIEWLKWLRHVWDAQQRAKRIDCRASIDSTSCVLSQP